MSGQEAPPKEESVPHRSTEQAREEAIAPAEAIPDFGRMYVRSVQGVDVYEVLRLGSGNKYPKSYRVDLGEMECTCEDHEFNRETHELCKHMAIALFEAPKHQSVNVLALQQIADYDRRIEQAVQTIERKATGLTADAHASESASSESGGSTTVDASDAAETLQEAYDELVDDMQVKAHEGIVWVKTGQDTPEEWPYPGADETWPVLIKNPEQVEFVGEGDDDYDAHRWYDLKPGEYWKNAIDPDDVEAYIEEVLE